MPHMQILHQQLCRVQPGALLGIGQRQEWSVAAQLHSLV